MSHKKPGQHIGACHHYPCPIVLSEMPRQLVHANTGHYQIEYENAMENLHTVATEKPDEPRLGIEHGAHIGIDRIAHILVRIPERKHTELHALCHKLPPRIVAIQHIPLQRVRKEDNIPIGNYAQPKQKDGYG